MIRRRITVTQRRGRLKLLRQPLDWRSCKAATIARRPAVEEGEDPDDCL